jgi:hypothetical protein
VDDPRRQLEPYLRPGEQLLWAGRPDPAVHLTPADVFVIPFSLLWGGFALFWTYSAAAGGAPLPFVLFGVPFVALGLYMLVGRFVYKAQRKRATAYGVTTERVLVAVGDRSLSDTPVRHQPLTVRSTRSGRHVSAVIGRSGRWPGPTYANTGMEFLDPFAGDGIGLYDVADGRGLRRALDQARGSPDR